MSSTRQGELFVIITGSSRGAGAATAIALAEAGYDIGIGINYREKERRARQVATRVEDLGRKAVLLPGDISTPDGQQHLLDKALRATGRLYGPMLNASGDLEKGAPPDYPTRLNRDAQVVLVRPAPARAAMASTVTLPYPRSEHGCSTASRIARRLLAPSLRVGSRRISRIALPDCVGGREPLRGDHPLAAVGGSTCRAPSGRALTGRSDWFVSGMRGV